MPFKFSLAPVLRYRKSLEQRAYLALEALERTIAGVQAELAQLEEQQQIEAGQRLRTLESGMGAYELQTAYDREVTRKRNKAELLAQLEQLHKRKQELLAVWHKARQDHELVDRMRERQHEMYRREQERQQQKWMDDLTASRRIRE
jgi:flagellar export protein FliJ